VSPTIVIEPADLRRCADSYRNAHGSLTYVRGRLTAVPPDMPGGLLARVSQVLEHSLRDLTEQLEYISFEAAALMRRARLAEIADDGRFNPFLDLYDPFGLGLVPTLGARFEMPKKPSAQKKGFWDKGIPGFFSGAAGNLKDTVVSAGDIVSMAWDGDERSEMWSGVRYASSHPGEAWDALWADVSAEEQRKAGNESKAAGSITIEVLGLVVAPLKLTKLKSIKQAADAADAASTSARRSADAAEDAAAAARRRLAEGPRWRTGEVPWQPTGPAPGRWADRDEFRSVVLDPADQAAAQAHRRADDAQQAFVEAQRNYDRWNAALENAHRYNEIDTAATLERLADELDQRGTAQSASGSAGW